MSEKNLFQKLLEVKKAVKYIKQDGKSYSYDYASSTNVLGTVNKHLNDMGVVLVTEVVGESHEVVQVQTKKGPKPEILYALDLLFTWVNVNKPEERLPVRWKSSGVNGEEKGLGSALTYAERYFILKQFNIPTDKDDPDHFDNTFYRSADQQPQQKPAPNVPQKPSPKVEDFAPGTPQYENAKKEFDDFFTEKAGLFTGPERKKYTRQDSWTYLNIVSALNHIRGVVTKKETDLQFQNQ